MSFVCIIVIIYLLSLHGSRSIIIRNCTKYTYNEFENIMPCLKMYLSMRQSQTCIKTREIYFLQKLKTLTPLAIVT